MDIDYIGDTFNISLTIKSVSQRRIKNGVVNI